MGRQWREPFAKRSRVRPVASSFTHRTPWAGQQCFSSYPSLDSRLNAVRGVTRLPSFYANGWRRVLRRNEGTGFARKRLAEFYGVRMQDERNLEGTQVETGDVGLSMFRVNSPLLGEAGENGLGSFEQQALKEPVFLTEEKLDRCRSSFALELKGLVSPGRQGHLNFRRDILMASLSCSSECSLQVRVAYEKESRELRFSLCGFGWGDDSCVADQAARDLWCVLSSVIGTRTDPYLFSPVTSEDALGTLLALCPEHSSYSAFQVIRTSNLVELEPPKARLGVDSDRQLHRVEMPYSSSPSPSYGLESLFRFMRSAADSFFVVNFRPHRLTKTESEYLGALAEALQKGWQLRSRPAALGEGAQNTQASTYEIVEQLLDLQQRLAVGFQVSIAGFSTAQSSRLLGPLLGGEILGLPPAHFTIRQSDPVRIYGLLSGDTEPESAEAFLVNFLSFDDAIKVLPLPVPIPSHRSLGLPLVESKHIFVPSDLPDSGLSLGVKTIGDNQLVIRLSQRSREQHLWLFGQTGTGKSSLLLSLILQDIESGHGVGVIDPHGDLAEGVLSALPDERLKDLVLFEPANVDCPTGVNLLEWDRNNPSEKSFLVDELLRIFDSLYDLKATGGPMFESYARAAVMLLLSDPSYTANLEDVERVFVDRDFRACLLERCPDPLLVRFWKDLVARASGETSLSNMAPYITSKFDRFVKNAYLAPALDARKSAIDFDKVLDGKIFVANLSKGLVGNLNARLLGMVLSTRLLNAAMKRSAKPRNERVKFYLYVDEFHSFTTDTLVEMASEGRKFGLVLTLANQSLAQLWDRTRDSILGNVGSLVLFRLGPRDAWFVEPYIAPQLCGLDVLELPNYHAVARLVSDTKMTRAFTFQPAGQFSIPDAKRIESVRKRCGKGKLFGA